MLNGKVCCASNTCCNHMHIGLFILRLGVGIIFTTYGYMKVSGMEGVVAFFGSLGFPAFLAYAVAYIEFIGGIAMILGLFSRVFGALFAVIMATVLLQVKWGAPITDMGLDIMLFTASVALVFLGSGRYGVGSLVNKSTCCTDGTCVKHTMEKAM